MQTFADIINQWEKTSDFAADIGVTPLVARQMRNRDSIDPAYWTDIVAAAQRRGIKGITEAVMARLAKRRRAGKAA